MKKNIITGLFFSTVFMMLSLRFTYALFSSNASNMNNTFSASSTFPTATPSIHIVINEVSTDGNNKVEWAELYNPTGASMDISGWLIGNGTQNDPLPAGSTIASNGYAVIIPDKSNVSGIPGSATTIILIEDQIGNGFTDAGDSIVLLNSSSTIIDQLSYGSDSSVFASPPAAPASGQTLARSPNGTDFDIAADWVIDSTPTIGQANL